jgi:catalase
MNSSFSGRTPGKIARALTIAVATALTMASAHASESDPVELVDALNGVFGQHAGARGSHAKGFCAVGTFTPAAEARQLSSAKLLSGPALPALVRFSIGGGNPKAADKSRSARGLAVHLATADEAYDLVLISEPVFFAATPQSFVSFLKARQPDPDTKKPDPKKIEAHNARFPEGKLQGSLLAAHAAPYSYGTTPYFSNHAFRFVAGPHREAYARIVAEPVAGTRYLTGDEEKQLPDLFLEAELTERLTHGPVEFDLRAQIAGASDALGDPSVQWAADGQTLAIGRLSVRQLSGQACDQQVFIPTTLPGGIEPSDDPVLKARAASYQVSAARRAR